MPAITVLAYLRPLFSNHRDMSTYPFGLNLPVSFFKYPHIPYMNQDPLLITARMATEYAYCPRLTYLIYVDGRWEDNYYTEHGNSVHYNTDQDEDTLPDPFEGNDDHPNITRSVLLTSESLGICAKLDIAEIQGNVAIPVEIKRGRVPDTPLQCYEPERVQLMFQGLLLRSHGYHCTEGMIYYASSKRRIKVQLDDALEVRTHDIIARVRTMLEDENSAAPLPLLRSKKCLGCSLAPICLPDETNALLHKENLSDVRRLFPARNDALPLYIQEKWAKVCQSGDSIIVKQGEKELGRFGLKDVSEVVLCGNISITTPCLHKLCESGIPIVHMSSGHWFYGITQGEGLKNAFDRAAQFAVAADSHRSLHLAQCFIRAKAQNQRTLLRRNGDHVPKVVLNMMKAQIDMIKDTSTLEELLGIEGSIAAIYFKHFNTMIKTEMKTSFQIDARNRRPPKDPINAMLSFGYALLAKEISVALTANGLDPWWGIMHRPRHGKPALALDLMEEFRPLIVDSVVITAINTGRVKLNDFIVAQNGCVLTASSRKTMISIFEQRLDQLITHPLFEYRCSWRAIIRVQVKLLARYFRGELREYPGMITR